MKRMLLSALLTLSCAGAQVKPKAPVHATLAFTHVRVFDGEHVAADQTVLVDGARIVAMGSGLAVPEGAREIDGKGKTLLPGLIDAHAHVMDDGSLRQALAFGVTTMLDLGSEPKNAAELKQAAASHADLADLRSAGYLVTAPHGHGTEYGMKIPTLASPEEAAAFIDARVNEGSDFIKLILEDGSGLGVKIPTLSAATVKAAVAEAHRLHKKVVVHVGSAAEAEEALAAGADGLAHTFFDAEPTEALAQLAAHQGSFVTPTLSVIDRICEKEKPSLVQDDPAITALLSAGAKDALTRRFPLGCAKGNFGNAQASVRLIAGAHVPLLAGTDAPNPGTTYGASLHEELAQLVKAGLTPVQALVAATSAPAHAYGLDDRGRIAEGLRADLVLVDGDPSVDITATRHLAGIWRGGVAFDRAEYAANLAKQAEAAQTGALSDFDAGQPATHFGAGWMPTTDQMVGGTSEANFQVVPQGAHGSAGALEISGAIHAMPYAWAGALALLGDAPFAPVDLSSRPTLHFFAKGHGERLRVMLFAKHLGSRPAVQTFVAGNDWTEANLPLSAFDLDGKDLTGVAFVAGPDEGPFKFEIDEVRFE